MRKSLGNEVMQSISDDPIATDVPSDRNQYRDRSASVSISGFYSANYEGRLNQWEIMLTCVRVWDSPTQADMAPHSTQPNATVCLLSMQLPKRPPTTDFGIFKSYAQDQA